MSTVHDVAALVLERLGPMSAMKLQKLVYYSQAWAVTLLNRPLFQEEFQAWAQGPVAHELFALHRGRFVVNAWPSGNARSLDAEAARLVHQVLAHYGRMSAEELSELTHAEAPWNEARAELPAGHRSAAIISRESMRRFYSQQARPLSVA
jgi:uncharacterized phage-associated protein